MQAGYREPAPEQAIVVTIGPLGFGRVSFLFFPLFVMLGGAVFLVVFTFSFPEKTPGALDCRRTDSAIQCVSWIQGGYSNKAEGTVDELRITKRSSRSGSFECLELRGANVDCLDARRVEARLRALRPSEEVSFDRSRHRDHAFLFLAGFMALGGVLCAVLVFVMVRRRRQTSWVKVTPRAIVFPEGQLPRVAPEGVRAVCVARQRYEIQVGHDPQWQTVHARQAYAGDLDPFAAALRDALAKLPLVGSG